MVALVAGVEVVEWASEHEAAWLERSLLEHELLPFNRTAGGQEVEVYLRLDTSARSPGLTVVHELRPAAGVRYFGPYLGGLRVRLAAAGLRMVFPLDYAVDSAGIARELGTRRGGSGGSAGDRDELAGAIGAVLRREPGAVAAIRTELAARRDAAARAEVFEVAGRIQEELAAVDWVTAPQRVAGPELTDAVACGWADGVLTRFEISSGRIRGWHQSRRSRAEAAPLVAQTPPEWRDFADRSARLAARLDSGG